MKTRINFLVFLFSLSRYLQVVLWREWEKFSTNYIRKKAEVITFAASKSRTFSLSFAGMVEQADTTDLKSVALIERAGSIPATGTIMKQKFQIYIFGCSDGFDSVRDWIDALKQIVDEFYIVIDKYNEISLS